MDSNKYVSYYSKMHSGKCTFAQAGSNAIEIS